MRNNKLMKRRERSETERKWVQSVCRERNSNISWCQFRCDVLSL